MTFDEDQQHANSDTEVKFTRKSQSYFPSSSAPTTTAPIQLSRPPDPRSTSSIRFVMSQDSAINSNDYSTASEYPATITDPVAMSSLDVASREENSPDYKNSRSYFSLSPTHLRGSPRSSPRKHHSHQQFFMDPSNSTTTTPQDRLPPLLPPTPEIQFHDITKIIHKIDESLSDLDKLSPKHIDSHDPSLDELENSFEEKLRKLIQVKDIFDKH